MGGRSIAARHIVTLHGLDMSLDLHARSELLGNGCFEPARDLMRLPDRERVVDLEIERYRKPALDRMYDDMMHRKGAAARDHHDTFEHGLVIESPRLRGHGHLGPWAFLAHFLHDAVLERSYAVERKRAAHCDHEVGEQYCAGLACAQPLDCHDPRDTRELCCYLGD